MTIGRTAGTTHKERAGQVAADCSIDTRPIDTVQLHFERGASLPAHGVVPYITVVGGSVSPPTAGTGTVAAAACTAV